MSTHSSRAAIAMGAVVLVSAHAVALHHVAARLALPVGAMLLVLGLVVVKHAGLFTALRRPFRRGTRLDEEGRGASGRDLPPG